MIDLLTLTDGGQGPERAAEFVSNFIADAKETLDIALYDLALRGVTDTQIDRVVEEAAGRGVRVRFIRNADFGKPIPVPPPPHVDPSPLKADTREIPGIPDLMHHKYVVRDRRAVLTGSGNWTQDAWTRQENVFLTVPSQGLASMYARNFEELWEKGEVQYTGKYTMEPTHVDRTRLRVWFCPGRGPRLAHRIADAIADARERIRICSPVITSGPVLGTLCEVAASGRIDLSGCYDGTQMDQVNRQWREEGHAIWKIDAFASLIAHARFGRKQSTPYAPHAVHDYMHAKVTVCDDRIFVGSYNLSHSGEENAENVLEIEDPALADRLTGFIDSVTARYTR